MAITPLPTAPSRGDDSDTFVARADAFVAALPVMIDEIIEQFSLVISGLNYNTTSTTSVAIGSGSKSFTVETDKLLQIGQWVNIASAGGPSNFMFGQVTSYNSGTGALVVNVTTVGGSGTLASWVISLSPTGAAGADIWLRSQTFRVDGTPAIVDSTNSTAKKIELRDNGVMKGAVGNGTAGANLMDSGGTARVEASTTGISITGATSATDGVTSTKSTNAEFFGFAAVNSNAGSSSAATIRANANGSILDFSAYAPAAATYGNKVALNIGGTATALVVRTNGTPQTEVTSNGLHLVNHGTTASAANGFVDSGSSPVGRLLRSTSSRRYKTNIEDIPLAECLRIVRALRSISYTSLSQADDATKIFFGFVAEEVAAVSIHLVHWTALTDDIEIDADTPTLEGPNGVTLIPDGVMYDRLGVIQNKALNDTLDRIVVLEAA